MNRVSGKIIKKEIAHAYDYKIMGIRYYLVLRLENRPDNFGIDLGGSATAQKDSTYYRIDSNKIYTFYFDRKTNGLVAIKDNGKYILKPKFSYAHLVFKSIGLLIYGLIATLLLIRSYRKQSV